MNKNFWRDILKQKGPVKLLETPLIVNGKVVKDYSLPTPESCYYKNSVVIKEWKDRGAFVTSHTPWDGSVVLAFEFQVTEDCQLVSGKVNCFTYDFMEMDEGYFEEVLEELKSKNFAS